MRYPFLCCTLLLTVSLTGCSQWHHRPGPSTLGQQLVDLKDARDRGALTEQEYSEAKAMELKLLSDHAKYLGDDADTGQGKCGCGSHQKCGCGGHGGGSCGK